MAERFEQQAEEIMAICKRLGIHPTELGSRAAIAEETMRKYAKGYQEASEMVMSALRNVEKLGLLLKDAEQSQKDKRGPGETPYSWMEAETVSKTLVDLAKRFQSVGPHEKKFVLSNLRDVIDELDTRELTPSTSNKPQAEDVERAKTGQNAAGEIAEKLHDKTNSTKSGGGDEFSQRLTAHLSAGYPPKARRRSTAQKHVKTTSPSPQTPSTAHAPPSSGGRGQASGADSQD